MSTDHNTPGASEDMDDRIHSILLADAQPTAILSLQTDAVAVRRAQLIFLWRTTCGRNG
jgi:hypothetical protein